MKRLLFVCVENAGRSKIAEALANHYGQGKIVARSAGTKPAERIQPEVIEVLKEKGIDITSEKPRPLTQKEVLESDMIVTMRCELDELCPTPLLKGKVIAWNVESPKGKTVEEVRRITEEIEKKLLGLLGALRLENI